MSASRKITKRNEEDLKFQDQTRRVEAAARELHRNFHQKKNDNIFNKFHVNYDEEDEDDDAASCSSSDLFELDHLALIGNDRYQEELPVYETTHIDTNRAIANGLLV
ncbi:Protein BIG GRAIN 1-like A [Vitis vinifera]|nr:Protein BIG GRAIN 1-like A [Vitis vinifera]